MWVTPGNMGQRMRTRIATIVVMLSILGACGSSSRESAPIEVITPHESRSFTGVLGDGYDGVYISPLARVEVLPNGARRISSPDSCNEVRLQLLAGDMSLESDFQAIDMSGEPEALLGPLGLPGGFTMIDATRLMYVELRSIEVGCQALIIPGVATNVDLQDGHGATDVWVVTKSCLLTTVTVDELESSSVSVSDYVVRRDGSGGTIDFDVSVIDGDRVVESGSWATGNGPHGWIATQSDLSMMAVESDSLAPPPGYQYADIVFPSDAQVALSSEDDLTSGTLSAYGQQIPYRCATTD